MARSGQYFSRDPMHSVFLCFVAGKNCVRPVQDTAQPDHMYHFMSQNIDKKWVQIFRQVFSLGRFQDALIVEFNTIKIEGPALVQSLQAAHSGQHRVGDRFPAVVCLSE